MAEYIDIQRVYGLIDDLERNPDVNQFTKTLLQGVRVFLAGAPIAEKYDLDGLEKILCRYFNVPDDTYAYNLTRVKEGFAVGTVTLDDFKEFDEEVIADLANYIREHLPDKKADARKEKECKYCHGGEYCIYKPHFHMYLRRNPEGKFIMQFHAYSGYPENINAFFPINYCPKCGRELVDRTESEVADNG